MNNTEYKPLTTRDWILPLILLAIPLVNIIMLIVWAASEATHPSKKGFARAYLILIGVLFGIGFLAALILPLFIHHAPPTPAPN
jgi:hypothetical protein